MTDIDQAISSECPSTGLASPTFPGKEPSHLGPETVEHERCLKEELASRLRDMEQMHETLRESEEKYRRLTQLMPVAVYSTDQDGLITFYNEKAAELWGRQPRLNDSSELRFCGSWRLFEPDGTPVAHDECPMAQAVRYGRTFRSVEICIERTDGSRMAALVNIDPILDSAERVVGAINVIQDITERKHSEQAIRSSEAKFRQLADAMPQIVWAASAEGTVDYYNRRWYEVTGAAEGMIGDDSFLPSLHPDDRQRCLDIWYQSVRTGLSYEIQYRFKFSATGEYRWHLGRALPVRDASDKIIRWFGTCTDINDHKLSEERSNRLNETLVSVMQSIPEIVFVTDPGRRIEFNNPAASRFASAVGMQKELPAPILAELDRVLETGEHHLPTSFKTVHRFVVENEERYFLSRIVAMTASNERPFGAVVMLQDVTQFRLLDEVKTNLISTVSHELKTPITSLRTALTLLLDGAIGILNPKQDEMVNIASQEVERLLRTLNALLDLTRFEDSPVGLRLEIIPPQDLVCAAVEEMQTEAIPARIVLESSMEPDLPAISLDRERILHVLTNLITNAIKYSPAGAKVVVDARRDHRGVRFSVRDEGPGIPPQYHSRLFEKFFRVPGTSKKGAGLGLAIARDFVRAHGGNIGVHSEPGKGTEFHFVLPTAHSNGSQ